MSRSPCCTARNRPCSWLPLQLSPWPITFSLPPLLLSLRHLDWFLHVFNSKFAHLLSFEFEQNGKLVTEARERRVVAECVSVEQLLRLTWDVASDRFPQKGSPKLWRLISTFCSFKSNVSCSNLKRTLRKLVNESCHVRILNEWVWVYWLVKRVKKETLKFGVSNLAMRTPQLTGTPMVVLLLSFCSDGKNSTLVNTVTFLRGSLICLVKHFTVTSATSIQRF